MAYAYPATVDLTGDAGTGLTVGMGTGSTIGTGTGSTTGTGTGIASNVNPGSGGTSDRRRAERFDVLKEFKHKIDEDENYVIFFLERIRVEEQYIEGLTRLYDRTSAIDSLQDDIPRRGPRSSSRRAWLEVRDYTQREVEARQAMVAALKEDVVARLVAVKDTQSRIRQRIREDMKHSNETYDDYASSKLPKLKRSYVQKCQIVEDIRRQEHAIAMQARLLSTPSPTSPATSPLNEQPNPTYPTSPATHASALPASSSQPHNLDTYMNQPVQSSAASTVTFSPPPPSQPQLQSLSNTKNRNRAGSGSGLYITENRPKDVLNDIALQSKKGFNAFMQRLGGDKGGGDKDDGGGGGGGTSGGGMGDIDVAGGGGGLTRRPTGGKDKAGSAMKGVRAKREAEDADKAYRYGIFHLESLRIRRDKLQTSAVTSLEQFNEELNITLRATLERYIDTLHGTAVTTAQATGVARTAIAGINLERDMSIFRAKLPASGASQTAPVLYENYYVGPCRSLIFGVSLTDYDFARGEGSDHGRPPAIVEKCIAAIDQRGLDSEGIYRISGRHAGVQETVQRIEVDEEKFAFDDKDDVFSISNILKQYLRQLPEPVFPLSHAERVKHTENRESHIHSNFSVLRGRLRRMAPIHQTTFQAIIEHLGRIQMHSAKNKMDAKNLAVVFNNALFGPDQLPSDGNVLTMHLEKDTVLEDLITFSDLLFGDESPAQAPTVLPPGSALSRAGVLSYHPPDDGPQPGSSRTKIRILDPEPVASETSGSTPKASSVQAEASEAAQQMGELELKGQIVGSGQTDPIAGGNVETSPKSDILFTPDDELDLLFDPQLIPSNLTQAVGQDLHIRPLSATDFLRSHFPLLSTLSTSPPLAPSTYKHLFTSLKSASSTYYIVVIVSRQSDTLVASGTLIVERKFIHAGGLAGHIEDIVVSESMQGRGLGAVLVKGLKDLAGVLGCYKTILDCREEKVGFYKKCGFEIRGRQMAYYVPHTSAPTGSALHHPPGRNVSAPPLPPRRPSVPVESKTGTGGSSGYDESQIRPETGEDILNDHHLHQKVLGQGNESQHENKDLDEDSQSGSPRTFASASSGQVTYSYPLDRDGEGRDGRESSSAQSLTGKGHGQIEMEASGTAGPLAVHHPLANDQTDTTSAALQKPETTDDREPLGSSTLPILASGTSSTPVIPNRTRGVVYVNPKLDDPGHNPPPSEEVPGSGHW